MPVKVRRIVKLEVDVPNLHTALESARKAANISVSKVCREADISRNYWYNLVNDKETAIAEKTLKKLEDVLGAQFEVNFNSAEVTES